MFNVETRPWLTICITYTPLSPCTMCRHKYTILDTLHESNSPTFSGQIIESPENLKAEFRVRVCQLFHAPSIPPAKASDCLWLYLLYAVQVSTKLMKQSICIHGITYQFVWTQLISHRTYTL